MDWRAYSPPTTGLRTVDTLGHLAEHRAQNGRRRDPQVIARQRPLVIGIALLLGALGGCATGQVSQTASQAASVNGASGQAGSIAVRDAEFVFPEDDEHLYPSGSSAALKMTIVNTGGTKDRLVAVQSPLAASVHLEGTTTIPAHSSVRAVVPVAEPHESTTTPPPAATPPPAPPTPPHAAPPHATTASPTAQPTASPTTPTSAPDPDLAPDELTITLEKLTEDIKPGQTVRVVLLFEQAGEIALDVPIAAPDEPRGESTH
jgi:copper(I)-binding protein